ncbi:MAG TPA: polyprenyl synthetase family protein [Candidatus Eremiobacteraceae bacterium]|nr:polyprenyl synthetase family protein [Candidatus Eremiobacteraceae bacterium]
MISSSSPSAIREVLEQFVREELSLENTQIASAVWAMLDAGGKELRPRITLLAAGATSAEAPRDPVLASYMELIHVATLIHDDVVDNARLRRGKDSTNNTHGNRFSVLAGDYLFSWVFKKATLGYDNPVPNILSSMLSEICNGEVKQLRASGNLQLQRDQYFEIIGKKTAELFASSAEVGSVVALQRTTGKSGPALRQHPTVQALRAYGWAFGMAFQVRDDILDVIASEAALGKPAGSDLRERKVTLPLILAMASGDSELRRAISELFASDDAGATPQLADVVQRLRQGPIIEAAQGVVRDFEHQAQAALQRLNPSKAVVELEALTHALSEYTS